MTRVLLLADDPSIARAAAAWLAREDDCDVESTSSVSEALERLARDYYDFVVVDRAEDCLVVARKIDLFLQGKPNRATLLVPTAAAFGLESVLASTNVHVRDLVEVTENAIHFRLSS